MKTFKVWTLIFGLAAGLSVLPPPAEAAEDALVLKARAMIDALSRGDFEASVRDFDEIMKKLSGPDKMSGLWKQLPAQLGAFQRRVGERRDKLGAYDIVLVTCAFEKTTMDFRVVFNADGRIGGLQLVPTVPPAVYAPPAYADPARFSETEVTVGSEPWALPGTLTMPRGEGPFPGLVLVHGSGPNDRDETLGPNKPFRDLAWGLAGRGIAVLRYEKRTRVHSAKLVADPKFPLMTVKEETIDDAVAAARVLQKTPGLDPKRVFILGHSLGGMLMPRIALAAKDLGIAGFISMAGLTFPFEDTYLRQMTYLLSLDGQQSDEDKKQLADIRAQVEAIKALRESDRGSTKKLIGVLPSYWLDLRGYDPAETAKSVDRPMLFLQGQRDYQVVAENLDRWRKSLKGRSDVVFKLFPKLNHLFGAGEGLSTPDEYLQTHKSVAEEVVEEIASFIRNIPAERKDGGV